jgi:hypothetical protein
MEFKKSLYDTSTNNTLPIKIMHSVLESCKKLTGFESESKLLYDWRFTANQFVLVTSPLRPTTSIFIFQLNT